MKTTVNHFRRIYELGYTRLVPIIPPGAPLSENSTLFRRIQKIGPAGDARGKAPGLRGSNGWYGLDLTKDHEVEFERWHDMGAGVGIKTGQGLVAIDADTMNKDHARSIKQAVEKFVGRCPPLRIGQFPKALYLVRTDPDFIYTRIEFGARDAKGRLADRVEILADGRQFVAHGIHPKTNELYDWRIEMPKIDELPYVSGAVLHEMLEELRPQLPAASELKVEGVGAAVEVDQESLRGDPKLVEKAVHRIVNTSAKFPTRESYLAVGYAIKAALPDDPAFAFELFADFCFSWQDGENDPEIIASDWDRMKPPFRRGAQYLYRLADEEGDAPGSFTAEVWFDADAANAPENQAPLFPDDLPNRFEEGQGKPEFFEVLTIDQLFTRPDPVFLLDRHIPEKSVGFLYGDPGTGKSFIALDWALTMAFEKPDWFGDQINHKENGCVIYIAGEGASGFKSRVAAWQHRRGVSGDQKGRFGLIHQSVDFMSDEDMKRLLATIRKVVRSPVSMIVVDTVSRALPGTDENLQKEMSLFVKTCDVVRDAFDCAVLGVHHAGKNGDMRGSTVLRGAGDFIFKLERKRGASIGRLICEKQKDAPDGWSDAYRFDVVTIGPDRSSLVPERCEDGSTGEGAVLTPDASRSVLEAMRDAWMAGEPWGRSHQSGDRWAVRRMVQDFHFAAEQAENVLAVWIGSGAIVEDIASKKSKRKGLRVVDITAVAVEEEEGETPVSVFD